MIKYSFILFLCKESMCSLQMKFQWCFGSAHHLAEFAGKAGFVSIFFVLLKVFWHSGITWKCNFSSSAPLILASSHQGLQRAPSISMFRLSFRLWRCFGSETMLSMIFIMIGYFVRKPKSSKTVFTSKFIDFSVRIHMFH